MGLACMQSRTACKCCEPTAWEISGVIFWCWKWRFSDVCRLRMPRSKTQAVLICLTRPMANVLYFCWVLTALVSRPTSCSRNARSGDWGVHHSYHVLPSKAQSGTRSADRSLGSWILRCCIYVAPADQDLFFWSWTCLKTELNSGSLNMFLLWVSWLRMLACCMCSAPLR